MSAATVCTAKHLLCAELSDKTKQQSSIIEDKSTQLRQTIWFNLPMECWVSGEAPLSLSVCVNSGMSPTELSLVHFLPRCFRATV